jgi:hypothetical protein
VTITSPPFFWRSTPPSLDLDSLEVANEYRRRQHEDLVRMRFAWILLVLSLAVSAAAVGCGPKNKYCPETGGPCFPPDETPDGGDDADGAVDGETATIDAGIKS